MKSLVSTTTQRGVSFVVFFFNLGLKGLIWTLFSKSIMWDKMVPVMLFIQKMKFSTPKIYPQIVMTSWIVFCDCNLIIWQFMIIWPWCISKLNFLVVTSISCGSCWISLELLRVPRMERVEEGRYNTNMPSSWFNCIWYLCWDNFH